jgi:hypothetical protein
MCDKCIEEVTHLDLEIHVIPEVLNDASEKIREIE